MLELHSISKSFPGVKALDDVSIAFRAGESHALVGENGAGKSTLIKIITGIYKPDAGKIVCNGETLRFRSYRDSLDKGIDIVSQEIQVIPESSIAENIMLDKMITYGRTGIINWRAIRAHARKYMDMVGLDLPPTTIIKDLSAAHKQLVQIAKALAAEAKFLMLDEPTSSLTEHEANNLFDILRRLREQGTTIVFVTHKCQEVLAVCDKVSVLRDGRHVGTRLTKDITAPELIKLMIGRECDDEHLGTLDVDRSKELLRAEHVTRHGKTADASFTLHEGEILGFYGLVGAGRTELARILIGEDGIDSGAVYVRGEKARIRGVADGLHRYRMGYVTENRKEEGLLLDAPVRTNITITIWSRIVNALTRNISMAKERKVAADMVRSLAIKTAGLEQKAADLSGGNQQKVSIAKWLAADCDILIIDEPTVGVDVGAKEQIHKLIWGLAKEGRMGIILISSDMREMIKLASRILVFRDHKIVAELRDIDDGIKTYESVSAEIGRHLG